MKTNRNIKFRAWDGQVMLYEGATLIEEYVDPLRGTQLKQHFFPFDGIESGEMVTGDAVPELTLMQYLGLNDSTDTEIFEGDVVTFHSALYREKKPLRGVIEYNPTTACFVISQGDNGVYVFNSTIQDVVVIGNIYEHKIWPIV